MGEGYRKSRLNSLIISYLSLRAIAWHKIVWNDFEQALLCPKGRAARSKLLKLGTLIGELLRRHKKT